MNFFKTYDVMTMYIHAMNNKNYAYLKTLPWLYRSFSLQDAYAKKCHLA